MFLNDNLISTLNLIRENNEEAYDLIVKYVAECPYVRVEDYTRNPLTIETVDTFNGKIGTWNITLGLDETRKVDSIELMFTGAPSSRLPYTENLTLKVNGFNASKTYFGTELANMSLSRKNNYRYSAPGLTRLSSRDIRNLSSSEVVSSYSLKAKVDKLNKKFIISSNEKLGDVAQAGEITTRTYAEMEA